MAIATSVSLGLVIAQERGVRAVHEVVLLSQRMGMFAHTIAREVAQVEPRGGHLRHVVEAGG